MVAKLICVSIFIEVRLDVYKRQVRAYNRQVVFQAKTLQTDADIDDYVEKIRSQLKQLLKNCDEIKLN